MVTQEPPLLYAVDLGECEALAALAPEEIVATFRSALEGAGANVVQTVSHHFPGDGLTSVLILRESHAVLHTWPETGTVNVDIFSCSPRLDSLRVVEEMRRSLGAHKVTVRELSRADGRARGSRRGHRMRARLPLEPSRRGER